MPDTIKIHWFSLYGNENSFFWHNAIFWSILVSNLTLWGTMFVQNGSQNRSRERLENYHVFKHVFGWILTSFCLPKGRFFSRRGPSFWRAFSILWRPCPLSRPSAGHFGPILIILTPFWTHLAHVRGHFGTILDNVGATFESFFESFLPTSK